jgi:hypothetical protein
MNLAKKHGDINLAESISNLIKAHYHIKAFISSGSSSTKHAAGHRKITAHMLALTKWNR